MVVSDSARFVHGGPLDPAGEPVSRDAGGAGPRAGSGTVDRQTKRKKVRAAALTSPERALQPALA
jgi:hypothetical protein